MAGLNLTPNPAIMAVQAGVFLANIYVVKKLWLDPYMKVYKKRQEKTRGAQSEAESILKRNVASISEIDGRISQASIDAKAVRARIHDDMSKEKNAALLEAAQEAEQIVQTSRAQLEANLEQELQKIPKIVNQLSNDFYAKVIS